MRCCIISIGLVLLVGLPGSSQGRPTELTSSWVYEYFSELRLRHPQGRFFVNTGPYERDRIAAYAEDLKPRDERSIWLRKMLMAELGQTLEIDSTSAVVRGEFMLASFLETDERARASSLVRLAIRSGKDISLWTLFRATLNGPELHKIEARPWKRNARASIEAGGMNFRHGRFSIFLGRDEVSWGIDRRFGLLFSGSAHAFDMVKLNFRTDRFFYTTFASRLRRGEDDSWDESMRRYVAAHRLEFAPASWLNLGLAETVIYGGKNRPFELAYQNPLTILYAEQWNLKEDDNILISADIALNIRGKIEAKAEVLIDDFQYDFKSKGNKIGLGIEFTALNPLQQEEGLIGFSYFHIRPGTYSHRIDYNRFTQEALPIGYPDGSDCDRFGLWSSFAWREDMLLTLGFVLKRKGEGEVFDSGGTHLDSGFLQGTVERDLRAGCELAWHPSQVAMAQVRLEWYRTTNLDNLENRDESGMRLGFEFCLNTKFGAKSGVSRR